MISEKTGFQYSRFVLYLTRNLGLISQLTYPRVDTSYRWVGGGESVFSRVSTTTPDSVFTVCTPTIPKNAKGKSSGKNKNYTGGLDY